MFIMVDLREDRCLYVGYWWMDWVDVDNYRLCLL